MVRKGRGSQLPFLHVVLKESHLTFPADIRVGIGRPHPSAEQPSYKQAEKDDQAVQGVTFSSAVLSISAQPSVAGV